MPTQIADSVCPNCAVGHLQQKVKPYVKVYWGHLFTIPRATCFICDVCDYHEWDEASIEIAGDMIFTATHPAKQSEAQPLQHPNKNDIKIGKTPPSS